MSMYAKLMSRITESSLMEEPIEVRYCFMMMLAISDMKGYAVGTDIALARRMNMPLGEFRRCIARLMMPDENSNSKDHEGRRIIPSDCERGYFVVNYATYRDTRDEEHRREYMREYMRNRRQGNSADVNSSKHGKQSLAYAESESEVDAEADKSSIRSKMSEALEIYYAYPKKVGKDAALKKILKALKTVAFDTLLEVTKSYAVAVAKKDRQFIPHPMTWFGQGRYGDDQSEWVSDVRGQGRPTRAEDMPEIYVAK